MISKTKTAKQIQHILAVAQWIEDHPEEFDMRLWGWSERRAVRCGSTLCIGGTSDMLREFKHGKFKRRMRPKGLGGDGSCRIAKRFGIPVSSARQLCFGSIHTLATPEKGVACLRDIAAGRDVIEAIEAHGND